jgi:hypothetical protein
MIEETFFPDNKHLMSTFYCILKELLTQKEIQL